MTSNGSPGPSLGLRRSNTALLTTFRRTGEPVATPVSIAVIGESAWFATAADSGKAKRLARNPDVLVAPCSVTGKVLGESVPARARVLPVQDRRRARRLLRPTSALFWSYLNYRVRGKRMNFYELIPRERVCRRRR